MHAQAYGPETADLILEMVMGSNAPARAEQSAFGFLKGICTDGAHMCAHCMAVGHWPQIEGEYVCPESIAYLKAHPARHQQTAIIAVATTAAAMPKPAATDEKAPRMLAHYDNPPLRALFMKSRSAYAAQLRQQKSCGKDAHWQALKTEYTLARQAYVAGCKEAGVAPKASQSGTWIKKKE